MLLEKREIGTTDLIFCRTEEAGVEFWPSQGTGPCISRPPLSTPWGTLQVKGQLPLAADDLL